VRAMNAARDASSESVRTLVGARLCPVCGVVLAGRQRSACSARCRRERSRQRQTTTTAAELATLRRRVAELEADNVALRQKVAEWTNRFANLKREMWQTPVSVRPAAWLRSGLGWAASTGSPRQMDTPAPLVRPSPRAPLTAGGV
jgi:hypothetical protein